MARVECTTVCPSTGKSVSGNALLQHRSSQHTLWHVWCPPLIHCMSVASPSRTHWLKSAALLAPHGLGCPLCWTYSREAYRICVHAVMGCREARWPHRAVSRAAGWMHDMTMVVGGGCGANVPMTVAVRGGSTCPPQGCNRGRLPMYIDHQSDWGPDAVVTLAHSLKVGQQCCNVSIESRIIMMHQPHSILQHTHNHSPTRSLHSTSTPSQPTSARSSR